MGNKIDQAKKTIAARDAEIAKLKRVIELMAATKQGCPTPMGEGECQRGTCEGCWAEYFTKQVEEGK